MLKSAQEIYNVAPIFGLSRENIGKLFLEGQSFSQDIVVANLAGEVQIVSGKLFTKDKICNDDKTR